MTLAEIVEQLLVPLATASGALASLGRRLPCRPSNRARLSFGSWLALALERHSPADQGAAFAVDGGER